jgi:antitoxin HicB
VREAEDKTLQHHLDQKYPIEIVEDDDSFVASIPDLPGCVSFGNTAPEALENLQETKLLWLKGRIASGEPVPPPSQIEDYSGKFVLRIPRALHRSLDREAKKQGVSLNQYILHLLSERHAVSKIESVFAQATWAHQELGGWNVHPLMRGGLRSFSIIAIQGPEPSREAVSEMLTYFPAPPKTVRQPLDLSLWDYSSSLSEGRSARSGVTVRGKGRHAH